MMIDSRPALTLVLPYPDRSLSLNGRLHWRAQREAQHAQQEAARLVAQATVPVECRPYFARFARLWVTLTMERPRGGRRWDAAAVIEATKGYLDGVEGVVYPNDDQICGFRVVWDKRPTGTAIVRVTIAAED